MDRLLSPPTQHLAAHDAAHASTNLAEAEAAAGLAAGTLLELTGCPGEGKTRTCVSFVMQAALQAGNRKEKAPNVLIVGEYHSLSRSRISLRAKMPFFRHPG